MFGLPQKNKGRTEKLAKLIGVSKMTVSYWFDGKFLPSKNKREMIANELNVSQNYLEFGFGGMGDTIFLNECEAISTDMTAEEETAFQASQTASQNAYQAEQDAKTAKENLKTSAKAKLVAGTPLTEEEANTIVL